MGCPTSDMFGVLADREHGEGMVAGFTSQREQFSAGEVLLDASLAEMTTGIRSVAARIAQPFFRRPGGGSKIPIRISGTRTNPAFGLDVRRALLPG